MTYTFRTINCEHHGSSYGYHEFTVNADSRRGAWDEVRKLTPWVLEFVTSRYDPVRDAVSKGHCRAL